MKMIDEALRYAKAGIPVFPLHWLKQDGTCSCRLGDMCQAKGKHPRIKNWGDEATTDVAKITGWWNQTPLANIGIPMGEKSGLVTLDVDTRHDGDKSLTDLITEYGPLPKTITATTGSGGKHYVFKYTEELALKNVVGFRDGLDVRTQGGLIVAAPSLHQSGNRYAWDDGLSPFECEAAEMPSWLVDEIRKVGTKITQKKKTSDKMPRKKIKYFDIIFHPDEYKAIKENERILKFVFEFSVGDYPEHLLFVTLEDKYIRPFIKIMKSRTRCYREEREENEVSISGEQVQVNVKYEDYLKDTDSSFSRMLASYCDHDVYIFKFEDITAQEAQEFIGKEIDAACTESAFGGTRARYILISSKPRDSLELKDPLLKERVFSAPAYNLIS